MTTKQVIELKAKTRQETGKQVNKLRQADKLPAVLYGHGIKNQNIVLDYHDFAKALDTAGESSLIDLSIDEQSPTKVLIHDIERDPVSYKFIHADFYQVKMDEKLKAMVELNFINEPPAVRDLSGALVKALDHVEIECLPNDLLSHIDVDLSTLKTFDDIIRVKDLSTPETVDILTDVETPIALVEEPKKIEEIEEIPEEEPVEGEGEGEEKKEGEGKKEAPTPEVGVPTENVGKKATEDKPQEGSEKASEKQPKEGKNK